MKKITDSKLTYAILIDMGFRDDGLSENENRCVTNGNTVLVECYDQKNLEFGWVNDKNGVFYTTIQDLIDDREYFFLDSRY